MFNEFCITGIVTSVSEKTITIQTNFSLNKSSITRRNVKVNYGDGSICDYTVACDNKNIIITFTDWLSPNTQYFLYVSKIEDALNRTLRSPFEKIITIQSGIVNKVAILKPVNNEAIKNNIIEIEVKATPEDDIKQFYYEISSDVAFSNIIESITTKDNFITVSNTNFESGQYFVRCRVQDADNNLFGNWSEPIGFIYIKEDINKPNTTNNCEHDEFIDEMLSVDSIIMEMNPLTILSGPNHGSTDESIFITFDRPIDPKSLPSVITLTRRDL